MEGLTPLLVAVSSNQLECARLLLDHGGQPDERMPQGYTALHVAAYDGHADLVEVLLAHGARVNVLTNHLASPLHFAARHNRVDAARLLLAHGADIATVDKDGFTALHICAKRNHVAVAQLLLAAGTPPDTLGLVAARILLLFFLKKKFTLFLLLPPSHERIRGHRYTPLYAACKYGHADMVRLLLSHGATATCGRPLPRNISPLSMLAARNCTDIMQILIDHAPDAVHHRDAMDKTPL